MMELVALDKAVSTLQLRGLRKQFFRGQVYVGSSMVGFILSLSFINNVVLFCHSFVGSTLEQVLPFGATPSP